MRDERWEMPSVLGSCDPEDGPRPRPLRWLLQNFHVRLRLVERDSVVRQKSGETVGDLAWVDSHKVIMHPFRTECWQRDVRGGSLGDGRGQRCWNTSDLEIAGRKRRRDAPHSEKPGRRRA